MSDKPQPSMSISEFARHMRVSRITVVRWIKMGRVPAEKDASGYYRISGGVIENMPITATDFAKIVGVSRRTVGRWCREGLIYAWRRPGSNVWEVAAGEVDAFGHQGPQHAPRRELRPAPALSAPPGAPPILLREWGRNPMIFAAQRRLELKARRQVEDDIFGGRSPKKRKPRSASAKPTSEKAGDNGDS
jgi:excisionase family DNA binding protein